MFAIIILTCIVIFCCYTYYLKYRYKYPVPCSFKDRFSSSETTKKSLFKALDEKTVRLYVDAVHTELLRQGVLKKPFLTYEIEGIDYDAQSGTYFVQCSSSGKKNIILDIEKQSGAIQRLIVDDEEVKIKFSKQYVAMIACIRFDKQYGIKRWEQGMFGNDIYLTATVYPVENSLYRVRFAPNRVTLASMVDVFVDSSNGGIDGWYEMLEG